MEGEEGRAEDQGVVAGVVSREGSVEAVFLRAGPEVGACRERGHEAEALGVGPTIGFLEALLKDAPSV